MPRFYFPATDGRRRVPDESGIVLANADAARREARSIARELLDPRDGAAADAWKGWRIQVLDEAGSLVTEVALDDVACTSA